MRAEVLDVFEILVEVLELLPGGAEHHDGGHVLVGPRVGPVAVVAAVTNQASHGAGFSCPGPFYGSSSIATINTK